MTVIVSIFDFYLSIILIPPTTKYNFYKNSFKEIKYLEGFIISVRDWKISVI